MNYLLNMKKAKNIKDLITAWNTQDAKHFQSVKQELLLNAAIEEINNKYYSLLRNESKINEIERAIEVFKMFDFQPTCETSVQQLNQKFNEIINK